MISLLVSSTADETRRMVDGGPRRDFLELAKAVGGEVRYQRRRGSRRGWRGKLYGEHVRQAWAAARTARAGDVLFADGEHIGLPLAIFLGLRAKRRQVRVVMLGHLVTRRWKRALFWLASRTLPSAVVLVHSIGQREALRRLLPPAWEVEAVPYQVDTCFWTPRAAAPSCRPLIVAVGSEGRDHVTLVQAARGLSADVVIAAGSHWARTTAGAGELPANVDYRSTAMTFGELRDLYTRATMVVVPLADVPNQSGVTCILEAMSMGKPVIVSASHGQRECVSGPLVLGRHQIDSRATADRGPWLLNDCVEHPASAANGLYVPVGDALALRAAIERLRDDPDLRERCGMAGREYAERYFSVERYTSRIAEKITGGVARA